MRARQPERFRALRSTWRWATVAFVVVVAPMVYTAVTDFSGYFGRAAFVSVFNSGSMSQDSYPGAHPQNPGHVLRHRRPQPAP